MSAQVLERDIVARPPVRHAAVSGRQLGLAGSALLVGIGTAWTGTIGGLSGASLRAPTTPMSAATLP